MLTKWVTRNNRIQILDLNANVYVDFCEAFKVNTVILNPLTRQYRLKIELEAMLGPVEFEVERADVNRDILKTMVKYGLSLPDTALNAAIVQDILFQQESEAERKIQHSELGFIETDSDYGFLGSIGVGFASDLLAESEYCKPEKTAALGLLEEWRQGVQNLVLGHAPLELALALAGTAPVAYVLNSMGKLSFMPVIGIIGNSSSGKTTMLKLMSSLWGVPDERTGLIYTTYATTQAFFKLLSNRSGFPVFVDECSGTSGINFTEMLYSLAVGKSKARLDSTGRPVETTSFFSTVFITSENSILKQTTQTRGLSCRILEFELPWTKSAEHAHQLQDFYSHCHGTAWLPLVELILNAKEKIAQLYEKRCASLQEKHQQQAPIMDGLLHRLLDIMAVITTAAKVLCVALDIKISVKKIEDLLLQELPNFLPEETDSATRAYHALLQFVVSHRSKFYEQRITTPKGWQAALEEDFKMSYGDWWGKKAMCQGRNVIWIIEEKFNAVLTQTNLPKTRSLLKSMEAKGYLLRHSDRYLKEIQIAGSKVLCYSLINNSN